jgi:hypothetical protein
LLRALIVQRHWQRFQTFEAQFRHAARDLAKREHDPGLAKLTVSSRQWERWYSGNVKTEPRPDACRVLEHMLGYPVDQLLAPAPQEKDQPASELLLESSTCCPFMACPQGIFLPLPDVPCRVVIEISRLGTETGSGHGLSLVTSRPSAGA